MQYDDFICDRLSQIKNFKYKIEMDDKSPVKQLYKMSRKQQRKLDLFIDDLIEHGVVESIETSP